MKLPRVVLALGFGAFLFSPCYGETLPASSPGSMLGGGAWSADAPSNELVPQTAIYYVPGGAGLGLAEGNAYLLVEPAEWETLSAGDIVMVAAGQRSNVVAHRLVRQRAGAWMGEAEGKMVAISPEVVRGRVYGVVAAGAAGAG